MNPLIFSTHKQDQRIRLVDRPREEEEVCGSTDIERKDPFLLDKFFFQKIYLSD